MNGATPHKGQICMEDARRIVKQAAVDNRLNEILHFVSNKHQQIVISGWARGLSSKTIAKQVGDAGGCYSSAETWSKTKLTRWFFGWSPKRRKFPNRFIKLLDTKAENEGRTPQEIISGFPRFLQPLAERIIENPDESMGDCANAVGMTKKTVNVLESTKLLWLAGGTRPNTGHATKSFWELVDDVKASMKHTNRGLYGLPASLRNELWWRKHCKQNPVDINKVATCHKNWGKRSKSQEEIFKAVKEQLGAGRILDDIITHVREQLGYDMELYVLNAISPCPWTDAELGIKVERHELAKIHSVIRSNMVPEDKRSNVTDGLRELAAELNELPEEDRYRIISKLNQLQVAILTQRGLKTPPIPLAEIVDNFDRLGIKLSKHRMTVLRNEIALVKKLRVWIDLVKSEQSLEENRVEKDEKTKQCPPASKSTKSKRLIRLQKIAKKISEHDGFLKLRESLKSKEKFLLDEWLLVEELVQLKKFLTNRSMLCGPSKAREYSRYQRARYSLEKKMVDFLISSCTRPV
jgi:hypothetical protein